MLNKAYDIRNKIRNVLISTLIISIYIYKNLISILYSKYLVFPSEGVGHTKNWLTYNKIETALGKKLTFHSFEFIKRTVSFYNAPKVHLNGFSEINSLVQEIEKGQNDFGLFCISYTSVKFRTR